MKSLKNKKGLIIFSLLCFTLVIFFYDTWKDEISLNNNKEFTIGRVTDFKYKRRRGGFIDFEFYANGKFFEVSDPDKSGWPPLIRESRAQRFEFYPVEYDITNPNNSKIQITEKPLGFKSILKDGVSINGTIENIYSVSKSYADLHIHYSYQQHRFRFRTRLHKDSLPCGDIDSCKQKEIQLIVSKDFPDINNLYYLSYDRIAMKKAKDKK